MFAWQGALAPGHERGADGHLIVGGVRADRLIAAYGTPLVAVDLALVRRSIDAFAAACDPFGIGISYAAKAFLSPALVAILRERRVGIDVCSLGELEAVESAGYPAERLTLHGAGKTDAELRAAAEGRVGRVVLDGLSDLQRLAELAGAREPVRVVLRLNTGVDVDTHAHVRTVGEDAKFGFAREEEAAAAEIVRASSGLRFAGLHAHAGSQIADAAVFVSNLSKLLEASERFAHWGLQVEMLVAGGGFGVQYDPSRPQDGINVGEAVAACAALLSRAKRVRVPALEFEPGRSLVAHAGTTLYEVLSVKRRCDGALIVVDGGMADNPRPMLYGAYHHVVAVDAGSPECPTDVFGRACESDFIVRTMLPGDLDRGAHLAVCTTGAYTYSMSSNYNGFPKPEVVGILDGRNVTMIDPTARCA